MGQRRAVAALVACGALALGAALAQDGGGDDDERDEQPIHERIDLPSIAACGGCHQEVYAEWAASLHHRAWTNPNIQEATDGFAKESCRPCHSPLPVLESGLDRPPVFRDFNHEDGVHCLSCHGLADGVAASRTIEGAPCKPLYEPRLLSSDSCWPCHEPTHQAFEEFVTSDAYALGVRCSDCHMQRVERAPTAHGAPARAGRNHGPTGGFNAAFVRRALAWDVALEERTVRVTLRNRASHKFPGEVPSRAFLVHVAFDDAEPEIVLLRKPLKGERRADDRLRPDETRTLEFPMPEGATRASVRLLFNPLPLMPQDAAILIGEWSYPSDAEPGAGER